MVEGSIYDGKVRKEDGWRTWLYRTDNYPSLLFHIIWSRTTTKDGTLTQTLATYARANHTMQFAADFEDRIRSLTVQDVNAAMRKHINPDRLQIVIAGDFEKAGKE